LPHTARAQTRKFALVSALVTGLTLSAVAAPVAAKAAVSPDAPVVIAEVYGGGGNSGAAFNRDFIEVRNVSDGAVDLTGWSVQYASAGGTSWQVTALGDVTLPADGSLLVGQATGANTTLPGFDADIEGAIAMSGTAGKVALVSSETAVTGAAEVPSRPDVIDFVGWGTANAFAGTAAAPATTNATSVSRDAAATNTADNGVDFRAGVPTPLGGGGTTDPEPEPDPVALSIAEIQGTGTASPVAGQLVTTTGVVTAHYATGGFAGYVLQTPGTGGSVDPSARTASDAVFVYAPQSVGEVALGDTVAVTGEVSEFNGLTEVTVAPGGVERLPDAPAPAPLAIEWPATDEERERLESMLVSFDESFTVTNTFATNQYGEVGLARGDGPLLQPTDVARPGTAEAAAVAAENTARRVTLDDGASINFLSGASSGLTPAYVSLTEPVVVGGQATLTAPVIVDWRNNAWKLNPVTPLTGDGSGDDGVVFSGGREAAPAEVGGDLSIASFNVLNFFTTLGTEDASCVAFADRTGDGLTVREGCDQRGAWDDGDLQRQRDKLVSAINQLDAEVVGLMEIENSARLGEAPDEATASLVAALNAAAGSAKWAYVPSSTELPDPASQDVITNAIIYQPAAATPVGPSRALGTQSGDDQAFGNAREPIAQVFRPAAGGERLLFVVNHFKSKGSPGPWPGDVDSGDGQGASNESRVRQATALRDWVSEIRGDVTSVALVGDFNAYGQEDPLQVLYDAGYQDAEEALDIEGSSYSFQGLSGSLDHILLSEDALARATGGDIWNINSGESVALEYSRYNQHGTLFFAPDPYRSSDHDPVVVGLEAGDDERAETRTGLLALPPVHLGALLRTTLVATVTSDGRAVREGSVEFREGDTVIATTEVVRGVATLRLPSDLARGVHRYTATFIPTAGAEGQEVYQPSTSREVTVRSLPVKW
jgi:5'-nucleotidase